MTAFRGAIPDFQLANPLYAGASVTFYEVDEDGERTDELATLYAAATGTATVANPQVLDGEGKFAAPVYIVDPVIAEAVGPNVSSHTTGPIAPRGTWKGTWATETRYYSSDFVKNPADQHKVYIATQDFLSGASFAADLAAGKFEIAAAGGDTFYFTVDDPGRPSSGEKWRLLIPEDCTMPEDMEGSLANSLVAATAATVFSVRKNGTQVGTIAFATGSSTGVFTAAAEVEFEASDELSVVAPNRDETLSGVAITIRLHRIPS